MEFIREGDRWKRQTYDGKATHDGIESNIMVESMDEGCDG